MENILKKNLCEMVKGKISENDLPKALEALEHFICLASINSKLQEKDLLQLLTGNIEEQKMSIGTWGNIETILKTLCKIVDPNQYQLYHEDHVKTEELYKDIFQLVPTVRANGGYFALTYVNPKTAKMENPNYPHIEAFVTLYKFRNDSVHMTEEISAFEINRLLPYICESLLYLCLKYASKLRQAALYHQFVQTLPAGWRSDREQRCCEKLNEIGYVDFHWMTKADCTTKQIALLDSPELENESYLKLIGTAGSGKTTALRQIYYILLRNYNQTSHKRIPIFYELKDLPDTDSPLSYIITKCYSVSQELADNLLETEELILLLDGYDELRDRNRKQRLALKLEEYLKDHKAVRVIITDRSVRNVIPILEDQGKVLRLRPFTEQDKRNYFEKNCTNTELKSLILEALSQKAAVFEELSTPLRLHAFLKFTERDGAIPDDFIRCFLDSLIERERKEKKDPNLDVLEIYLCAATVKTGQENNWVEESVLLSVMKKAADQLGRQGYDTQTALRLATEMGIMQIKEETEGHRKPKKYYRFETEEFMDYYSDILAEDAVLNAFFEQEGTT